MLHAKYNGYDVHLIEDVSEFEVIKKLCSKKVDSGVDTETSGLNITDTIAGVCLSCGHGYQPGQYHGFYLPIRHVGYKKNLPITAVMELTMWVINNFKTVWWNRDYDFNMLERDGCELPNCGATHDAQCMAHLVKGDPFPALKDFAHDYCKLEVIHFSDNNAENNNFQLTDPTVTFKYAAQDPIITVLVARKLWAEYPHIRKVYPIDNRFAECMRRVMNNTDLYLDLDIVNQQLNKVTSELAAIKQQIFSFTGYQFRLTSNKDVADALSRYVTLTAKTKKGAWDVSKEVLHELDTPLASMILKFKHLEKFRSTYLEKMAKFPQPFHINYQHANVATGRLSSGGSKGNDFFAPFNIQNVPKVEIFRYLHYTPATSPIRWTLNDSPYKALPSELALIDENGNESLTLKDLKPGQLVMTNKGPKSVVDCGKLETTMQHYEGCYIDSKCSGDWSRMEASDLKCDKWFLDLGEDVYSVRTPCGDLQIKTLTMLKCKGGMRDCFVCPEGYVWLSADYSSQEMVLMANFSNEPNLINPLLQGEDIHKYVGTKMFGHYDKSHRTIAKTINFASNYGASGYTIGKRLGKSTEEGQALLDKYNATMSKLYAWKQEMIKEGRRKGLVYTFFGRPRAVWMYYQSSDRSKHSFGDRTCMNSPVQGCLPGFTKVLTRSGYKPIVEVTNEEVWNGVAWTFAQLVPKGSANLVRLITEDGNVLYCDDRHMLKDVNYQWVNVMDLKPGDKVCLNNEDSGTITDAADFFYYLMGYVTGDGDVTEKWREDQKCWRTEVAITFGSHERERLTFIKSKLKDLGYNPHVRENIHKPNDRDSLRYQLCVYGHDIVDKLKSYGMVPNERAHTKHVPKSVWSTGAKSFLRGLYEADGCKGQNSWHMTNPDLLEEVALLLNQAGFSTRISKTRNAYKLMVRGNGLDEWLYSDTNPRCYRRDEVLPHHIASEITQYLPHDTSSASVIRRRIEKGGSCSMQFIGDQGLLVSEHYSTSRVKSVERLDEVQDMYTLATVHPLHQFVTEGFISKNTGGDIIRLDYIKYQSSIDPKSKTYDKEFAENTLHALTVHDEINLFVKPEYVPQAFNKLRSIMELSFPNWKVPLKVSPSVGMDWGHQIECLGFTEDGTMIPDCEEDMSLL